MKTEFKETELGMIPNDWEVKELDYCLNKITYGFTCPMPTTEEGPYMITAKDLINNKINFSSARKTSLDAYNIKLTDKSRPIKGDLLLSKDGTLGRIAIVGDEKVCISQSVALLRFNNTVSIDYIKYLLISPKYQYKMISDSDGSVIKHIYITRINKMLIPLPPLSEQKAIAKILSDLDEKIEINRKINENLEELGQTLFKRWFIDFEFPNEKGEPYKSSGGEMIVCELGEIPKGWKVGKVGNLNKVQSGYAFKGKDFAEKGEVGIIKIKNISNKVVDIINTQFVNLDVIKNLDEKFKIKSRDILIAMTGAEVAKIGIVEQNNKLLYLNQRVGSFKEIINKSKYYIYLVLITERYQALLRDTARGSAQPNISSSDIENIEIIVPSEDLIIKFGDFFGDIYNKLVENLAEIKTLQQTRDSLLPKLMSGQIRVK